MLVALGLVLAWCAGSNEARRAGFLLVIAIGWGSAIGRLIGFADGAPLLSIHGLLFPIECALGWMALQQFIRPPREPKPLPIPPINPQRPEDFAPLSKANFTNPYPYYRMLRDRFPVYRLPKSDFYLISRYEDIITVARDTETFSSKLTEIMITGKPKDPSNQGLSLAEQLGEWGVLPVDVLAIQDPPIHSAERKIAHSGFNSHFVKSLEPEVQALCDEMMNEFLERGSVEFIQAFAWRLPMRLIIGLLGLPEKDYEQIKTWCFAGIRQLSGVVGRAESLQTGCASAQFMRYLWRHYLAAKKAPKDNFTGTLIRQANDPDSIMTDQRAISTIFQLLIAGSDSSASSMGNALRMLALHPEIEQRLRREPDKINDFIEEVFRMESAFQGHFRLTKKDVTLHDITIPANSRVFLMWASGNRDERFWDRPEEFDIDRTNGKKHLTFGHGVHACIGRELARMEIRIVISSLLARTKRFAIAGETPFEASMFARTLVALPLTFERAETTTRTGADSDATSCNTAAE
jgi:cytochrome P450